jgi:acyl-CoA thioesterase-2
MTEVANDRAKRLLEILNLEKIEQNLYLGSNETSTPMRLFGGQVLSQAAMAAYRTVEGSHLHSLHGYFIRAGTTTRPVLYEVERIRDGRSFTTRRVVAIQNGEAIFNLDASFQVAEPGFDHSHPMPNVPLPEELEDDVDVAKGLMDKSPHLSPMAKIERPFEMRSIFRLGSDEWLRDRFHSPTWIRFRESVDSEDQVLARCLLAYASDMGLVSTGALPHHNEVAREKLQMASLDHALWVHRNVPPLNQWLLFHKRTSTAQGSRGMVHADFHAENGQLIATVTQEGLLRIRGA